MRLVIVAAHADKIKDLKYNIINIRHQSKCCDNAEIRREIERIEFIYSSVSKTFYKAFEVFTLTAFTLTILEQSKQRKHDLSIVGVQS